MRIPILMLLFVLIFSFCIDLAIWKEIRRKSNKRWTSLSYVISSICLWIMLIVVLCIPRRSEEADLIPIMWSLYAYTTIYIPKFIILLLSVIGYIPQLWKGKTFNAALYVGLPIAVITFCLMWWGALVTRHNIEITKQTIVSKKLPSSFDGYKIVQFSDAHVGTWGNDTAFISNVVDSINSLHPDIIIFTGDIVNRCTDEIIPFVKPLSRLNAKDGVFSVLGNHDYGDYMDWNNIKNKEANMESLCNIQKDMGWILLNNEHKYLVKGNDSIAIIGVENWGEPPFKQYGDLHKAYPYNLKDDTFKLLLSHNPEHWRLEVKNISNIDLTFAGHTHAMQTLIKIGDWKWSPAAMRYDIWSGMHSENNKHLYVNIGIGEVGMPFRIGATPEITLFTLKCSK